MSADKNLLNNDAANMTTPDREIRARFTGETIRVFQAYSPAIAEPAVRAQTFVQPFKLTRMTWIKPSFFWMMYRSGWATKEGQERVLAIDIPRSGFEWALENSCLSHFDTNLHDSREAWQKQKEGSLVRIQWDPERDPELERLNYRSIQIGLSGEAAGRYVRDWIQAITDVTARAHELRDHDAPLRQSAWEDVTREELPYPMSSRLSSAIGASV